MTCPLTGCTFDAVKTDNGEYIFTNVLTGEQYKSDKSYLHLFVPSFFELRETISPVDAAMELGVSRQRMTQLMREGTIPHFTMEGNKRLLLSDVVEYKEGKKK